MSNEKRTHERLQLTLTITLEIPSQETKEALLSRDFSPGGAFLESADPSKFSSLVDTDCVLTVTQQTEDGEETESIDAKIIRVAEDGIGVQFNRSSDK
jgi:hypothetical protein